MIALQPCIQLFFGHFLQQAWQRKLVFFGALSQVDVNSTCMWLWHNYLPAKLPDVAASNVDTWKSLRASSTSASEANGHNLILACDSAIRMIASSCLIGKKKKNYQLNITKQWCLFAIKKKKSLEMDWSYGLMTTATLLKQLCHGSPREKESQPKATWRTLEMRSRNEYHAA